MPDTKISRSSEGTRFYSGAVEHRAGWKFSVLHGQNSGTKQTGQWSFYGISRDSNCPVGQHTDQAGKEQWNSTAAKRVRKHYPGFSRTLGYHQVTTCRKQDLRHYRARLRFLSGFTIAEAEVYLGPPATGCLSEADQSVQGNSFKTTANCSPATTEGELHTRSSGLGVFSRDSGEVNLFLEQTTTVSVSFALKALFFCSTYYASYWYSRSVRYNTILTATNYALCCAGNVSLYEKC